MDTPYKTLASLDAAPINTSNFHTFGCSCYVLDHRLQSGTGKIPKWEPRARMGIYVGWLPSHASNVTLILNPHTVYVLPQFHVVYDDDFTTVPYLWTAATPPHWAELVHAFSTIALYTECKVGTWQSIPELDVDPNDFTLDTATINIAPSTTATQFCEGDDGHSEGAGNVVSHHKNTVTNQGQNNEIQSDSPDLSTTHPDEWRMPDNIDLDSSGLQCFSCSAVLGRREQVYCHSTISLKAQIKQNQTKFEKNHAWFSSLLSVPLVLD